MVDSAKIARLEALRKKYAKSDDSLQIVLRFAARAEFAPSK